MIGRTATGVSIGGQTTTLSLQAFCLLSKPLADVTWCVLPAAENLMIRIDQPQQQQQPSGAEVDPPHLHLRLIDFGSAVDAHVLQSLYGSEGPSADELTLEYAPPEALFGRCVVLSATLTCCLLIGRGRAEAYGTVVPRLNHCVAMRQ